MSLMPASPDLSSPPAPPTDVMKLKSMPGFIPGIVFAPNDDEMVHEFLIKKTFGKPLCCNFITDVDVYAHNPDQLPMEYEDDQRVWNYFFAFATGSRTTPAGYWKAKVSDEPIYNEDDEVVALKTLLEYYQGEAPDGTTTNWKMYEYRLKSIKNPNDPRMDSLVVCEVYAKSPARIAQEEQWMKNASKRHKGKRKAKKTRII